MKLTKNDDGSASLVSEHGNFEFSDEEFDDLVHAIPLNTTHLYRLLIDTLIEDEERKQALRGIIEAGGNVDATPQAFQKEALQYAPQD